MEIPVLDFFTGTTFESHELIKINMKIKSFLII